MTRRTSSLPDHCAIAISSTVTSL